MRIIAFGSKPITKRLIYALAGSDFEIINSADVFNAVDLLQESSFDLVVVDSSAEGAEVTCRRIREVGSVPIVLMIGEEQPDWKEMQPLAVDGYIPDGVNGVELAARLKAVLRRFRSANELKNEPGAGAPGKILTES